MTICSLITRNIPLQEVIAIGTRLIGEDRVRELLDSAESGKLVQLREASLYSDLVKGKFTVPAQIITKECSRDLILLALEV